MPRRWYVHCGREYQVWGGGDKVPENRTCMWYVRMGDDGETCVELLLSAVSSWPCVCTSLSKS